MTHPLLTPGQAVLLIWLGGLAIMALHIHRRLEKTAERDCVCRPPVLQSLAVLADHPGLIVSLYILIGALWPGIVVIRPFARWRHRKDPRCAQCGSLLRKDRPV